MEIIRLNDDDKRKYLDLLLTADEQESMIDRYLDRGDMFVLNDVCSERQRRQSRMCRYQRGGGRLRAEKYCSCFRLPSTGLRQKTD